jgi:hypothetical protein
MLIRTCTHGKLNKMSFFLANFESKTLFFSGWRVVQFLSPSAVGFARLHGEARSPSPWPAGWPRHWQRRLADMITRAVRPHHEGARASFSSAGHARSRGETAVWHHHRPSSRPRLLSAAEATGARGRKTRTRGLQVRSGQLTLRWRCGTREWEGPDASVDRWIGADRWSG